MSTPQSVSTHATPSSVHAEQVRSQTPICGPLKVAETTNSLVVPTSDFASIEKDEFGTEHFCLRDSRNPEDDLVVPVRAPEGRSEVGPWTSIEPALRNGQEYLLQISVIFPENDKVARLYGIFVPVSLAAAAGASRGKGQAEEPIVVWGSEDEGEGPDARQT